MVLPYSTMSGNEMTVWLLIFLSTDHCISGQGVVVHLVLVLACMRNLKEKGVLTIASTGFARCCSQAPGLGCTEAKLLLMLLWFVVTRTHTKPSSWKKRGIRRETQQVVV